jgi:heat shock protein HslJ
MLSIYLRPAGMALILLAATATATATAMSAQAQEDTSFPFGMEMTLDALPQPGSKRVPDLDIGDNGEVVIELWCKGGKGQFSVAGNTVIFVAGQMENRDCPPAKAQADDDLLAALTDAATWTRRGDAVAFIGSRTLKFHLNTN